MPIRRTQSSDPKRATRVQSTGNSAGRGKKRSGNRPPKSLYGPGKRSASERSRTAGPAHGDEAVRLQRMLAAAGFGSRRQCEELIEAGRIEVNGEVVTKLGTSVVPNDDKIRVDGTTLKAQKLVYFAVNKPVGFVTTNRDPQGRPRVVDLVPPDERVFPVGRLDLSSEGLILLTNDGELAQRLTHPKYGIRKVYRVTVAGKVNHEAMKKMRQGMYIAEGFVKVEGVKLIKARARATDLEMVLSEGKNREIRRILARLGHKVMTLQRIAVGTVRLGDVPPGAYRVLRRDEVDKLYAMVDNAEANAPRTQAASPKKPRSTAGKKRGTVAKKRPGGKDASVAKRSRTTAASKKRVAAPSRAASQSRAASRQIPSDIKIKPPEGSTDVSGSVIGGDAPVPESKPRSKRASAKRSQNKSTSKGRATKRGRSTKRGRR